jgi:myo-inositol-1-phosphate synthase
VLSHEHLAELEPMLSAIKPKKGAYDPECVRRIAANHTIQKKQHREKIETLRQDIRDFKSDLGAKSAVMIFCASTETHKGQRGAAIESLAGLEKALDKSDPAITPTMLYAYAAITEKVPFANGTPNASVETPALQELAEKEGVPIAGRDFKSGQTMIKTALAPALRARLIGLEGWYSTNILGNRDGQVLEDPDAFKSKEITKSGVLDAILEPEKLPMLYGNVSHKVCINYYPTPKKAGTISISSDGWDIRCRSR